jgi:sugar lactone lactonase YvrE
MLEENKNILNKLRVSLLITALLSLSSCSTFNILNVSSNNTSTITSNNNGEYVVNVNNVSKGGEITVKLGFSNLKNFFTKANTNGSPAKTPFDIKSYKLYLLKNSNSTYPIGGDPIADSIYTITVNSMGTYLNTVKFKGLVGSGSDYYYVAVIAYDGLNATGNELIKPNNGNSTPWSAGSENKGLAVSSGNGINVNDTTLVATPDSPLSITSNLIDAVGATIDVNSTVISGANSGALELVNVPVTYRNIVGTGLSGATGDGGQATDATLNSPRDVALDSSGNIYIVDASNDTIRKVNISTGVISLIAGGGLSTSSGINATDAKLEYPTDIAVDSSGNIYISEFFSNKVRKITTGGIIQNFAGTGSIGATGDGGQATDALLNTPQGLYIDSTNKVYIADSFNKKIRVVDTSGIITTIAGGGVTLGDNGNATSAQLLSPVDVSGDNNGNLYIADNGNYRIRKVTASGIITTYAGVGLGGNSGNGGSATSAQIYPDAIHTDKYGNVYFSDQTTNLIRKINSDGIISVFSGGGISNTTVGASTSLSIGDPSGISSDNSGNIYFADKNSNVVRKVF